VGKEKKKRRGGKGRILSEINRGEKYLDMAWQRCQRVGIPHGVFFLPLYLDERASAPAQQHMHMQGQEQKALLHRVCQAEVPFALPCLALPCFALSCFVLLCLARCFSPSWGGGGRAASLEYRYLECETSREGMGLIDRLPCRAGSRECW
jgi:hypothetical protein